MKKNILIWRYFLYLVLGLAVVFVLYKGLIPSGKIIYKTDLFSYNDFIKPFSPGDRVSLNRKDGFIAMIADPIYFNLRTPRNFSQAKLKFLYKNLSQAPVIRAGVLIDPDLWHYYLQSFENRLIDQVNLAWESQADEEYVLFTRPGVDKFSSLNNFFKNPPAADKIAVYDVNLNLDFLISDYESEEEEILLSPNILGSYQLFTYIKDENLFFEFDFIDLNKDEAGDDVDLFLYYKNHIIDSRHLSDEDCFDDGCIKENIGRLSFVLPTLPEGFYKIELRASNDIVTREIKTTQSKLVLRDKVVFADLEAEENSLFTNINNLKVKSLGPDLLQTIKLTDKDLLISKAYQQFSFALPQSEILNEMKFIPQGLELAGSGLFSFSVESFFDPQVKNLDKDVDLDGMKIDYIVSSYKPRNLDNNWRQVEIDFDLSQAYREEGNYAFMISAPGISGDGATSSPENGVLIKDLSIEFEGASVLEKLHRIYEKN